MRWEIVVTGIPTGDADPGLPWNTESSGPGSAGIAPPGRTIGVVPDPAAIGHSAVGEAAGNFRPMADPTVRSDAPDTPTHRYDAALANEIERRWQNRWDAEGA